MNCDTLYSSAVFDLDAGPVTVQFGGCTKATPNCLVTPPGWNYAARQYRPRKDVVDGSWVFPKAQPVQCARFGAPT